jgi:signal transduction histidine kinase
MALKLYHPQLCAKNITLGAPSLDSPLWVEADSNQMIRVFVNIVQNAIEAMSSGGGTLQVELKKQNGLAVAEFLDDGHGIKEPLRIFDPFYTTKPLGQGVGLGLSASYGIVHEHGGQITGEDRRGGGAIIKVELPITKGEQNGPTKE